MTVAASRLLTLCVHRAVGGGSQGPAACLPASQTQASYRAGPPRLAGLCFLSTSVTVFLGYTHHTGAAPRSLRPLEGEHATPPAPVRTAPDPSHSACLVELPHFRFRTEPRRGNDVSALPCTWQAASLRLPQGGVGRVRPPCKTGQDEEDLLSNKAIPDMLARSPSCCSLWLLLSSF